jgi:hypothetical protein
MKLKFLFLSVIGAGLLSSCVTTPYYQVLKATPSTKMEVDNNALVYENEDCKVKYNLWSEGGNANFQFYNKTEKNIYLNLDESFFILNGISYNYFKNRIFSNSSNTTASNISGATASTSATGVNYLDLIQTNRISRTNVNGVISSSGHSVSYYEEKIVCIPAKSSKIVTEYSITESLFRDCDLLKYPTKKQVKTKTFSKSESPFVFSNRIAYSFTKTDSLVRVENEFYVSEISNNPESLFIEYKYDEFCGQKNMVISKHYRMYSPSTFYVKYSQGQDLFWKH